MDKSSKTTDPKKWRWGGTLVIQKPKSQILWLTLILLVGFVIFGELFFRIDAVQDRLTGPRIGSRHRQFEIQVARLDKLVREGTPIDCIFLGNSMVWLGIDPLIVDQTFEDKTGQSIYCFNFGVSALPASSAGQIAQMLVERYHPRVLIYGTFARDYAIPSDAEDAYVVSDTPWLKYWNGDFTLKGWLYDHSRLFQYKGHIRDLMYRNYLEDVFVEKSIPSYRALGLDPKTDIRLDVRTEPDFAAKDNRDPVKWLGHFEIQPEDLIGLQNIVEQSDHGVQVIIVELPYYRETALNFFPNGIQDYETYMQTVSSIAASKQVPFWRLDDELVLPPESWWDYFHLNLKGVDLFSRWLGNKLAHAYQQNQLSLPPFVGH
jgi:hypothetical protein